MAVRCPICKTYQIYKYIGWFQRHMAAEHNWQYPDAKEYFEQGGNGCPKCGKPKINRKYCNNCGVFFRRSSTTARNNE